MVVYVRYHSRGTGPMLSLDQRVSSRILVHTCNNSFKGLRPHCAFYRATANARARRIYMNRRELRHPSVDLRYDDTGAIFQ
jgi:hypothetical protein